MERTGLKKVLNKVFQIALPLVLGAAILLWTYHDFDFRRVWSVLDGGMNYGWMAFSLVFGVLGHLFRGWRWNLTLAPLGEYPKVSNSVYADFCVVRGQSGRTACGGGFPLRYPVEVRRGFFLQIAGTVVTERLIDTICVLLITVVTLLLQSRVFAAFFEKTGTNMGFFTGLFTSSQLLYHSHLSVCLGRAGAFS